MELLFPLLIVALLVPMFLNVRKQKRILADTQTLQDSLKVGDEVVTTAGLYARVVLVEEDSVDLEIADGVITTWSRAVVREVLPPDADEEFTAPDDLSSLDNASSAGQPTSLEKKPSMDKGSPSAAAEPSVEKTSPDESVEQSARRLDNE